jgi:hypothetical protein
MKAGAWEEARGMLYRAYQREYRAWLCCDTIGEDFARSEADHAENRFRDAGADLLDISEVMRDAVEIVDAEGEGVAV